jgi:uncharacterized protein (TIGR00255 family)
MTLSSMTGFARSSGTWRDSLWTWEIKSVNGKTLDGRFRLPPGFDGVEASCRTLVAQHLKRGNVQAVLTVQTATQGARLVVNTALLDQLAAIAHDLQEKLGAPPIQAENLLALRGVLDMQESTLDEADTQLRDAALVQGFATAINALAANRLEEGSRLAAVVGAQITRIAALVEAAAQNPSRTPDAIKRRLAEQVARLLGQADQLDPQRLHQEAVLLATRADIQEELDRLQSHIAAARQLLAAPEPAGRKLDFLAQEFNREANTLCSKANDPALTGVGLELKTVIDQLREQIQNIE